MKPLQLSVIAGILAATTGAAMASSGSLNGFKPKVLPVLVKVNSQGKVTQALPASKLTPQFSRLLRSNLDEMISRPATDRHGHPISSQVVINLALKTTPNENGSYDAQFAYVSTTPVPSGVWHWVHVDGHRLALAGQESFHRVEPMEPPPPRGRGYPTSQPSYSPKAVRSATQSPSSPTPPPPPPPHKHGR